MTKNSYKCRQYGKIVTITSGTESSRDYSCLGLRVLPKNRGFSVGFKTQTQTRSTSVKRGKTQNPRVRKNEKMKNTQTREVQTRIDGSMFRMFIMSKIVQDYVKTTRNDLNFGGSCTKHAKFNIISNFL